MFYFIFMGVSMRPSAFIGVGLVILLCCPEFVVAEVFTVEKSYNSVDTLQSTELWNEYRITAGSNKKIDYSFEVKGSGTIMVFLIKGHSVSLSSDYYVIYSKDTPTRSYSNTFSVGSDDGTRFTLAIMTEEYENVTYQAKIKVYDRPATDYICGAVILFFLLFGGAIIGLIIRSRRKRKSQVGPLQQPPLQPSQLPQIPPPPIQRPPQQPPPPPPPPK
ncbi:MAG: hypothetical protein JSV09_13195 [Thermoplasmata archaeon]|nr:MAG: hypothetical protein JSV09_13195 [Thermoplasmata archaeon]